MMVGHAHPTFSDQPEFGRQGLPYLLNNEVPQLELGRKIAFPSWSWGTSDSEWCAVRTLQYACACGYQKMVGRAHPTFTDAQAGAVEREKNE
jgi:hypothetical protein